MRKRITIVITLLIVVGIIAGCGFPLSNDTSNTVTKDSLRFKEEYEALNSELDDEGAPEYTYLSINDDNNIVYLTYERLLDFIGGKTGILYFGRPGCPWCRLLAPSMLDFAKEDKIKIYYYDIEKDRDENNESYKNILSILGDHLPTDTVTQNEADADFDPDLKRVVLPQLFFIKKGAIKDDLFLFQHELLRDNDSEAIKQLLRDKYNSIK